MGMVTARIKYGHRDRSRLAKDRDNGRSNVGTILKSPDGLAITRASLLPGTLLPEIVDKLLYAPNSLTAPWGLRIVSCIKSPVSCWRWWPANVGLRPTSPASPAPVANGRRYRCVRSPIGRPRQPRTTPWTCTATGLLCTPPRTPELRTQLSASPLQLGTQSCSSSCVGEVY